jgi:hypothetical protein
VHLEPFEFQTKAMVQSRSKGYRHLIRFALGESVIHRDSPETSNSGGPPDLNIDPVSF